MVNSKITVIKFEVEKYIEISDFDKTDDRNFWAAIVGCIEGNIQINKEKSCFTLLGMYNIKCKEKYLFLSIYDFVKTHSECYNFIIKYFNLWHGGRYEEFTYDEYHKKDLMENFNLMADLIYEEMKQAAEFNDVDVSQKYEDFYMNLSSISAVSAS